MTQNKTKALKLSKQAQGMLAKVIAMIEQEEDCPAIIQQIDSVNGFLHSAKQTLLAEYLEATVIKEVPGIKRKTITELLKLYRLEGG